MLEQMLRDIAKKFRKRVTRIGPKFEKNWGKFAGEKFDRIFWEIIWEKF